ncbi:Rv1733c family protein [Nonomuraea sp. NPDC001699]
MKAFIDLLARRVRLYRPDGNPLRRRSDRLESVAVLVTALVLLAGVWPAVLAGRLAYEGALQEESAHAAGRHQVRATLLADAPAARVTLTEMPVRGQRAMARWTTSSGAVRSGPVPVPAVAKAGSTVPLWIDAAGSPAPPPADRAVLRTRGVVTGTLLMSVIVLAALGGFAGFRWWTDRRRYQEWEVQWARADEDWGRRRSP